MDFEQGKASRTYLQDYVTRINRHFESLLGKDDTGIMQLKKPELLSTTSNNNGVVSASVDKARYYPGETARIVFTMNNNSQKLASSTMVTFTVYHGADLITFFSVPTKIEAQGTKSFMTFWTTPNQDYQGYRVELSIEGEIVKVLAIDVSSNIDKFPRYGTLTSFTPGTDNSDKLTQMKDLCINSIEYYDAYWKPQEPIPTNNPTGNYTQDWAVWLSDADKIKSGQVVSNTVNNAHVLNIDSLFYNMIYAFTGDATNKDYLSSIGVDPTWLLHTQNGGLFQDNMDPGATGQTALDATQTYLDITNPAVADWIAKRMNFVLQTLDFDGWHGDTIGNNDPMNVLDSNGKVTETYSVKDKLGDYANLIKARLGGRKFVINSVAAGGEVPLSKSQADFPYSETWSGTYYEVDQRIKYITYESGKSLVIPGYLQEGYAKTHHGANFNANAVLLFDAIVYAAGGSRLEIVDGNLLLVAEFFPNRDLNVPDNLKQQMKNYQTFITAYENLLRDGQSDNYNAINLIDTFGNSITSSGNATQNTVYTYSRSSANYETLHLINMLGVSNNHWQDDDGSREDPTLIQDFRVQWHTDKEPSNVYLVSPDEYNTNQSIPLTFYTRTDGNGNYLDIQVPYLHRWDMLYFSNSATDADPKDYQAKTMAQIAQNDLSNESYRDRMANFDSKWGYSSNDLGVTYSQSNSIVKVWAPTAQTVQLITYNNSNQVTGTYNMVRGTNYNESNHNVNTIGVFSTTLSGDQNGTIYTFKVTHSDGTTVEAQDPYGTAVTDSGNKSVIVNMANTNPQGWSTVYTGKVSNPTQAIIGETNVRDFSKSTTSGVQANYQGKFLGMVQTGTTDPNTKTSTGFDYIKQSGLNYIELQPIADSSSRESNPTAYNWGYDSKNFNALDPVFASTPSDPTSAIKDYKILVQQMHQNGIGVVMDVVYNHVGGDAMQSSFEKIVPGYYFRKDASGNLTNGSDCGNDFASDHEMGRNFIINSINYWVSEYGIDGFRFDLMTSLSTKTMQAIQNNQVANQTLLFGEGWDMNNTNLGSNQMANLENANQMTSTGFFNGTLRDDIVGRDNGSYSGWVSGNWNTDTITNIVDSIKGGQNLIGTSFVNPGQNVNYIENHDNQTLSDKLWLENPKDDNIVHGLRVSLANAMNGLNQGITFTQIGQSFWRSKNNNDNSASADDTVNDIDWDYLGNHQDTDSEMAHIFGLKKQYPDAFAMTTYDEINNRITIDNAASGFISYTIHSDQGKFVVMFNSSSTNVNVGAQSKDSLTNNYNSVNFAYGTNKASNKPINENSGLLTIPPLTYAVYRFDS